MTRMIEVQGLTVCFNRTPALEGVNLKLEHGKIYGLLGRNGAGKTTLINAITHRIFPDQGRITIDGMPARENDDAQGLIYAIAEKNYMPDDARVRDLFRTMRLFYPGFDVAYAHALAERFGLSLRKKLRSLSTGYGTIAKLIAALSTDVPYVFLDEPVLGLDANHREMFYRELLENYGRRPRAFVLSTHLIEEISGIVEQVIIVHRGRILLDRPAEEIREMGYSVSGNVEDVDAYCAGRDVLSIENLGGLRMASLLGRPGSVPPELTVQPLELQQLFIRLTNAQEGIAS